MGGGVVGRDVCIHTYVYVYLWLILVDVWQKSIQYYEAIILQLNKKSATIKESIDCSQILESILWDLSFP